MNEDDHPYGYEYEPVPARAAVALRRFVADLNGVVHPYARLSDAIHSIGSDAADLMREGETRTAPADPRVYRAIRELADALGTTAPAEGAVALCISAAERAERARIKGMTRV